MIKDREYDKRAMTEEEDKYTFLQSTQICAQCGLIGHLRADMDTDGNGFFSTWNTWRDDLKTQEFKDEFDDVINYLREEGDILHNRKALANYCYSTPQSKMPREQDYYGVRVDSEKYAYLLRLNPNKGEYNLYCYCYRRDWLDGHLRQARHGIRFIDPEYNEKFRIEDGEKVRIRYLNGETHDSTCRYIDDYHVEVDHDLFHICELAEALERTGAKIVPLRSSLPERCYGVQELTGEVIILERGTLGFFRTGISTKSSEESIKLAGEYNRLAGVTKAQEAAMRAGSIVDFDAPAANPFFYDKDGKPTCKGNG